MKNRQSESMQKGFCTFCMGSYDPNRIGIHVRRCGARVDDANCIETEGREHPLAFLLMVSIEGLPEVWVCLEAHCEALLSDLDRFIRHIWFPNFRDRGIFLFSKRTLEKRTVADAGFEKDLRLDQILSVKDRFGFALILGEWELEVDLTVVGCLPTAIMHRPIDVAAFPLGSDGGRLPAGWDAAILAGPQ
jgi:hypothetical protein